MKCAALFISKDSKKPKKSKQKPNQKTRGRKHTDDETTGSADALEHLPPINKGERTHDASPGSDRKMRGFLW